MATSAASSPKHAFFIKLANYHTFLFLSPRFARRLLLKLNGKVYDLSDFVADHPGGHHILDQYERLDASRPFELAHHSVFAQSVAKRLLLWDPEPFVGRPRGGPAFARGQKE